MMDNVLQFRSSPITSLSLREIKNDRGGAITNWLAKNSGARARFRIRVENLRNIPRIEWNWKQFHGLEDGLAEIKWKAQDKEFRAIGFDFEGAFVMVIGCSHKQNVYDPQSCLETAKRLKGEVERGQWRTISFEP